VARRAQARERAFDLGDYSCRHTGVAPRGVRRIHEELDPDAEHPRILAAVKEIERWTLQREKVLVFGVFLRPLRLLRDVLNVRDVLRAADARRPIAHAVHTDPSLDGGSAWARRSRRA